MWHTVKEVGIDLNSFFKIYFNKLLVKTINPLIHNVPK